LEFLVAPAEAWSPGGVRAPPAAPSWPSAHHLLGTGAALALVSAVCSLVVAYEVLRYREQRFQVRHPGLAA